MNPLVAPTTAAIDPVFLFIFGVSAVMLLGITATMIIFVVRYNRSRHPHPTSQTRSNIPLEIAWTVIPTLLVLAMFYYGWAGYLALRNVPEGAMEVRVTGRMWSWTFEYPEGVTAERLYVPAGRPVRVEIHATDVLHSFYIPAFRVKRDAVPGMATYVWFTAPEPGSYDIFCAEYCGVGHAAMITTVEALPPEEFEAWLAKAQGGRPDGTELLKRYGCLGCHSLDGTPGAGPTFQGIAGRQVAVVTGGKERQVTADRAYLRRSIEEPQVDLVKGFPPIMPPYQGQIPPAELEAILDALEGKGVKAQSPDGAALAREKGCLGCHSTDGSPRVGPSFKGIFGRKVTLLRQGAEETLAIDESYLERAIREPQADLVKGYPPVMPPYAELSAEELRALLDYMRAL